LALVLSLSSPDQLAQVVTQRRALALKLQLPIAFTLNQEKR